MVPMKVLLFAQLSRVFITVPSLRTKSSETCLGDLLLLAGAFLLMQPLVQLPCHVQHPSYTCAPAHHLQLELQTA